jgi:hypothetical protein
MNRLGIAFLKNYNLKMQKTVFSNRKQFGVFWECEILKANMQFKGQTAILSNT